MLTLDRMYSHKNIRLHLKNYVGQTAVFATLCCFERRPNFERSESCSATSQILREAAASRNFAVHAYCFMPDHLHLLVEGRGANSDFLNFIKTFKLRSTRSFAQSSDSPLWQKKFFDHILRSSESIDSVALYIWLNPVRAGLAKNMGEYPFAGSLTSQLPRTWPAQIIWTPPKIAKSPPQKAASTHEA